MNQKGKTRGLEPLLSKDMGFDSKKVLASRKNDSKNGVASSSKILSKAIRGEYGE